MAELLSFPNVQRVLESYADKVRTTYADKLTASGRKASGALINSIRCVVVTTDTAYEVTMTLEPYWEYVEYDTRPHWPPVSAILRWVQVKPVIPRPGADGRIPTQKQLAYLIGRKIAREGTTGSHDLELTTEQVNAEYRPLLEEALAQDAAGYITRILESPYR